MNGIIKANSKKQQLKVRYFNTVSEREICTNNDNIVLDARDEKIEYLSKEVDRLNQELRDMNISSEKRVAEAYEAALAKGKEEVILNDTSRLELLEKSLKSESKNLQNNFSQLEKLSLVISHNSLSKIFGNRGAYKAMVMNSIQNQLDILSDQIVINIHVSATDFSNEQDIALLNQDMTDVEIVCDRNLGAGECKINLLLGSVDIGINKQWIKLSSLYREMLEI